MWGWARRNLIPLLELWVKEEAEEEADRSPSDPVLEPRLLDKLLVGLANGVASHTTTANNVQPEMQCVTIVPSEDTLSLFVDPLPKSKRCSLTAQ